MKHLRYLAILTIVSASFFASCGKDDDNSNDPREAVVGNYDIVYNRMKIQYNPMNSYMDTTYENDVTYIATIAISDTIPADNIVLKNIAGTSIWEDILARLIDNDILIDYNGQSGSFLRVEGTGTVSGNIINLQFRYSYRYQVGYCTVVATKRN